MAADTLLPYLPDLIVEKIFRLIPTKLAIRSSIVSKRWASVWSLGVPFLYFNDEGESDDRRKLMFMDFVESCLKHFERTKLLELDWFVLRMRYDSQVIDSTRLDKWFSFVVDRRVKELYISIRSSVAKETTYYGIPHTILNAQYLTHLNLQNVKIPERSNDLINLPLLKTMTLSAVLFDCLGVPLWEGCPSIEHLSLVSCSYNSLGIMGTWGWQILVNNSSLKFLHVIYCKCKGIYIEAKNLESFVFISVFPQLCGIWLSDECVKLKNISVYAHLSEQTWLSMPGKCPHNLKAVIDIPSLRHLGYRGYLLPKDVISVKALQRFNACLMLNWDDDDQGLEPPRTHFPTWRNFLLNFSCCNVVELDIHHDAVARALTFPENFRKTSSPPLLIVKDLRVSIVRLRCPQTMAGISAFTDSLRWMAPNARITLHYWNYYSDSESLGEDE
ncbi:hypothetical protein ACLB2K_005494 [Fragaria x ananassa]